MSTQENTDLELRDYLRVLRRRRSIIFLAVALVVGAAMTSSLLQTPVYSAQAEILLQPRSTESLFDPQTGQRSDPERGLQTEIEVLKSRPVRSAVRNKLGTAPKVSVSPVGQTDVIEVKAESTDPERAATVANAYAREYIDFRRRQAVDDLIAAGNQIQAKIVDLQRQIDSIKDPVPTKENPNPTPSPGKGSLIQQQALFKQKQDQLQVDAALKTGGAQLVTEAVAPTSPVRPTPVRSAALALGVGLIFGGGLAFLFEYLDDSIKGKDDLERVTRDVPTLGVIPAVAKWKNSQRPMVVSLADPKSPPAEAYRSLRTGIQFIGLDRPLRVIQVTSATAGEGKTTTLANLGVALAQSGERVIIVSCDLRRPRIHQFFDLSNDVGFTSVLLGEVPLSAAVRPVSGDDRMRVVPSGPIPPNPAELLAGRWTVEVLTALQAEADVVLVDCPPVLPVTDSVVLSGRVDGTLLVARAGQTTRRDLANAHDLLRQVDAPIIGTVLNGVTAEGASGYS
ncbi:MAG: polysaccharide biosynthesis tyrosine autokinase, partial [Actinomycetota bacterium]|nr:polysaccharide biosynthesis tyrosine autokinase [Actinomycetota bacterium]